MHASVSVYPALKPETKRIVIRQTAKALVFIAAQTAILLVASGRLSWAPAWIYAAYSVAAMLLISWVLSRYAPDLVEERVSGFGKMVSWDKALVEFLAVRGPIILCIVAGLDRRFGWSRDPGAAIWMLGLTVAVLGDAFRVWAMLSNRYFSSVVRIQTDRGHAVATSGPYRALRHPGYAGMLVSQLAVPLILGTLWAFVPALLIVAVMLLRTTLEDALLTRELPGYKEYASRVRYRLFPGLW